VPPARQAQTAADGRVTEATDGDAGWVWASPSHALDSLFHYQDCSCRPPSLRSSWGVSAYPATPAMSIRRRAVKHRLGPHRVASGVVGSSSLNIPTHHSPRFDVGLTSSPAALVDRAMTYGMDMLDLIANKGTDTDTTHLQPQPGVGLGRRRPMGRDS
jgi:hypothetical protein